MALFAVEKNSLTIDGIASISECIKTVEFLSEIDDKSYARSADIYCTLTITGVLSQNSGKTVLIDQSRKILEWSLIPSNSADCYKKVEVSHTHGGESTKYVFPQAFPVSYWEENNDQEKIFKLVVRQKKDMLADIEIS